MSEPLPERLRFCYRHPAETARRRCYYCRRWICPSCQIRKDRHIFCGEPCHWRWKRAQFQARALRVLRRQAARLIIYPLLAALVVLGWGGVHLLDNAARHEIQRLAERSLPVPKRPPPPPPPIHIQAPVFGARLNTSKIPVKGQAPPSAHIRLWENGEVVAETSADPEGRFEFASVPLVPEGNLLQVEYRLPDGRYGFAPAILVYHPRSTRPDYHFVQRSPDNLVRGNPGLPELAITFDGNNYDNSVRDLLAVLERERLPVTVFLTGLFIRKYPEAARALADSPWCEVGNHTWDHPHLTTYAQNRRQRTLVSLRPPRFKDQLEATAQRFLQLTGHPMAPLWRAPFGEHNREIRSWAAALGYTHVGWTTGPGYTLDSLDWIDAPAHPQYRPARNIVARWIAAARKSPEKFYGGIFLMHLGTHRTRGDRMMDHLPELVRAFRSLGFRFVFISTMLRHYRQPDIVAGVAPAVPSPSAPMPAPK